MKKTIKLLLIMIVGITLFTSCDHIDSSVDKDNVDMVMIEKYIQSDSTVINQKYPIFKKGDHEYVFNSENELIAKYNVDTNTNELMAAIFFFFIGFFLSLLIFAPSSRY